MKRLQTRSDYCSFTNLPIEVTAKIFDYLTPKQLTTVSQVCHQYLEISQIPSLARKICINFSPSDFLEKNKEIEELFQKSERKFFNLHFNVYHVKANKRCLDVKTELKHDLEISNIYRDIETFRMNRIIFTYQELWTIVAKMPNLKSLKLEGCCFLSRQTSFDDILLENITNVMANLTDLVIDFDSSDNLDRLLKMTNLTSNLKTLELKLKFRNKLGADKHIEILCSIIKKNKNTLEELKLYRNQWIDPVVAALEVNGLCLKTLILHLHTDLYYKYGLRLRPPAIMNLDRFLKNHTNLTRLTIVMTDVGLDFNLLAVNMSQLTILDITAAIEISNYNLYTIAKFKKLKILSVVYPESIGFTQPSPDVASYLVLRELKLGEMILNENDILNISENFKNLETFVSENASLTDNSLQAIIKHLRKLKHLHLEVTSLSECTSFGLSGFNCETNEQTGVSIKQLENLESLELIGNIDFSEYCLIKNIQFAKLMSVQIANFDVGKITHESCDNITKHIYINCLKIKYINIQWLVKSN